MFPNKPVTSLYINMITDLMCFVIPLCCGGPRQGHERRHIDDIEQLAEEEFEKLYHKYKHMRRQKVQSLCC